MINSASFRVYQQLLRIQDLRLVDLQLFRLLAVAGPSVLALLPPAWAVALWRVLIYLKVTGASGSITLPPGIDRAFYASVVQTGRTALDRPPR